jgi:hypothetical protein
MRSLTYSPMLLRYLGLLLVTVCLLAIAEVQSEMFQLDTAPAVVENPAEAGPLTSVIDLKLVLPEPEPGLYETVRAFQTVGTAATRQFYLPLDSDDLDA